MKLKLLSDIRVSVLFVVVLLLGPIFTSKGFSIVLLSIVNFSVLSEGYIFLILDFIIAIVLSNVVVWYWDKNKPIKKKK